MSLSSLNTVQNKACQINTAHLMNRIKISVVDCTTSRSGFLKLLRNYLCIEKKKPLKVIRKLSREENFSLTKTSKPFSFQVFVGLKCREIIDRLEEI